MSNYRRYSDEEKAQALAVVDACRGGYKQAAKETGIPWTTLRDWYQGRGVKEKAVREPRSRWRARLGARLEEKIDLLVEAIDVPRIAEANLVQVMAALRILVDKAEALHEAQVPTWEELGAMQERFRVEVAVIIRRHVHDPAALEAIAGDLDALAQSGEEEETETEACLGYDAADCGTVTVEERSVPCACVEAERAKPVSGSVATRVAASTFAVASVASGQPTAAFAGPQFFDRSRGPRGEKRSLAKGRARVL